MLGMHLFIQPGFLCLSVEMILPKLFMSASQCYTVFTIQSMNYASFTYLFVLHVIWKLYNASYSCLYHVQLLVGD